MINEFVDSYFKNKNIVEEYFKNHKEICDISYNDLVEIVIKAISHDVDYFTPDPEKIILIDHGEYQGTLVFVIAEKGYQPSNYWYAKISYGSCSGCDTLENTKYSGEKDKEHQLKDLMTLCLHIVQQIKKM